MQSTCLFPNGYRALVVGSSGTIGQALHDFYLRDPACQSVSTLSRDLNPGFDLENPSAFPDIVSQLAADGPFDLIIDATGALIIDDQKPEKALKYLQAQQLDRYFRINATGPILLLKALEPHMAASTACYAKLSARVGSIEDNQLGGWYGYRASKAALNMMLQTAAIELQRNRAAMRVVALHPGTVKSPLSAPFTRSGHDVMDAATSVRGMMRALWGLPAGRGAVFVDYQGNQIAW